MKKFMMLVTILVLSSCSTFAPMKMTCERTKGGMLTVTTECKGSSKDMSTIDCNKDGTGMEMRCGYSVIDCMCE